MSARAARREVLVWAAGLYAAWTGAWLVFVSVERRWPALAADHASSWWLGAKLLLWCTPVAALIARRGRRPLAWLGLDHACGLARALGVTMLYLLIIVLVDASVLGRWPSPADAATNTLPELVVILLVSPFMEEVLFRGYALGALREAGYSFWRANAEAALLFALLHLPGWFFQGRNAREGAIQGANVALLGVVFGAVRVRGASLWSSILIHVVNNLWSGGWLVTAARSFHGGN